MSNALANGVAGAGGGIIAQIVTYPLQTLNTRQQTERVARDRASSSGTQPKRSSKGTLAEIIQVIKTEGWGGLYSGLKPSLLGTAASQGIYYYFYQVLKNKAEAIAVAQKKEGLGDGTVGMFSWLVVAAMAGCANVLVTNPIWVIVTRMQTHTQAQRHILERARKVMASENNSSDLSSIYNKSSGLLQPPVHPYGTWHAVHEIYSEAGVPGFWKGIIPTLVMVCNPSIQFMIYETSLKYLKAKRQVSSKHQFKNVTALEVFLLGAIAKLGATVSTYPLLVVKSRLQANQEIGGHTFLKYGGTLDAIIKMIRYEGLHAFYKGMTTKIVQSVFAASVLFMMKEELVKAIQLLSNKTGKLIGHVAI
ncbi:peroxisomal nicotinamide adenine dinucleotide carrier-like isoform X2 [Nymphaea colorata]|uniref:peroxisomal nicotinamide adenine dinucleotide carrier-like isoform X2 n=1 Tax=Nymphaea colorata TaxID=210225 RepID=UPI00129EE0F0|nr:peroxisomal nicotinamide adenine dinucleotide carrier-like isoform X2 [Nymphaea colorata]